MVLNNSLVSYNYSELLCSLNLLRYWFHNDNKRRLQNLNVGGGAETSDQQTVPLRHLDNTKVFSIFKIEKSNILRNSKAPRAEMNKRLPRLFFAREKS